MMDQTTRPKAEIDEHTEASDTRPVPQSARTESRLEPVSESHQVSEQNGAEPPSLPIQNLASMIDTSITNESQIDRSLPATTTNVIEQSDAIQTEESGPQTHETDAPQPQTETLILTTNGKIIEQPHAEQAQEIVPTAQETITSPTSAPISAATNDFVHLSESSIEYETAQHEALLSSEEKSTNEQRTKLSIRQKLGIFAIIILSVGPVLSLVAMAMLAFLWFGNSENGFWREVMLKNWLTKAVAICSEMLRQAMAFQLGLNVAMLAALALEYFDVLLPDVASFSMMKSTSGSGTILVMLWSYMVQFWSTRFRFTPLFIIIVLTSIVFTLTQLISILLLSDINLQPLPSTSRTANTSYNLGYWYLNPEGNGYSADVATVKLISRGGTWFRKATSYPTFAEYLEPPYIAPGVSDTGKTLRAFLPFGTAQDRGSLQSYEGFAPVLDARVTCQIPNLIQAEVQMLQGMQDFIVTQGNVTASRYTPRLGNATFVAGEYDHNVFFAYDVPIPFSCLATLAESTANASEWKFSICQLAEGQGHNGDTFAGGLVSEFRNLSDWLSSRTREYSSSYGTGYLIFNVTTGSQYDWQAVIETDDAAPGYFPPAYSERGEWLDLVFNNGKLVLSVTLCYAAFDFADIPVSISSTTNRTEPSPVFNFNKSIYTFSSIRDLFGQDRSKSPKERGILQLTNQSWIATAEELTPYNNEPYPRAFADLASDSDAWNFNQGNFANVSGIFTSSPSSSLCPSQYTNATIQELQDICVVPDRMHIWLVQEILQSGGSVAFALQSMITLLSSVAYYDQMGQFDKIAPADISFFVLSNVPVSFVGFIVVAVTVLGHYILLGIILALFLKRTSVSRIGDSWNAVAEIISGVGRPYLEAAVSMGDGEIKELMEKDGTRDVRVGIGEAEEGIGVVRFKSRESPEKRKLFRRRAVKNEGVAS